MSTVEELIKEPRCVTISCPEKSQNVGKDHVFGGFYDPTITLSRSKEECIDEAKKLLDTCMKSDHFYFTFDKSVIDMKSVNVPKLQAVCEWVYENGKY
jgi:hypothetical protein